MRATRLARLAVLVCALVALCALGGCRESDEIRKIVFTQDPAQVSPVEVTQSQRGEAIAKRAAQQREDERAQQAKQGSSAKKAKKANSDARVSSAGDAPSSQDAATSSAASTSPSTQDEGDDGGASSGESGAASGDAPKSPGAGDAQEQTGPQGSGGASTEAAGALDEDAPADTGWEEGEKADEQSKQPSKHDTPGATKRNRDASDKGGKTGSREDDADSREVVDSDGNVVNLPEDVQTIAAPGEAGLIVQMLGGQGVLCASSESFLGNAVAQDVFADEGLADVAALWSDDGSTAMTDAAFETLLSLKPDCCLAVSGQANYSTAQIAKLKEAGIAYVTVDSMTMPYKVQDNVKTIGKILGGHEVGSTTSEKLAKRYVDWTNSLEKEVIDKNGYFMEYSGYQNAGKGTNAQQKAPYTNLSKGKYTTILTDWDDAFSIEYYCNGGGPYVEQDGAAVVQFGRGYSPVLHYLNVGGVALPSTGAYYSGSPSSGDVRKAADSAKPQKAVFAPVYQGFPHSTVAKTRPDGSTYYPDAGYWWAVQLEGSGRSYTCRFSEHSDASGDGYYKVHEGAYSATMPWVTPVHMRQRDRANNASASVEKDTYPGSERYPGVIAATQRIANKMEESMKSATGLYRTTRYGIEVPGMDQPFPESAHGLGHDMLNVDALSMYDYDVYVNPQGAGNWLAGSVESCLEAAWASHTFYEDKGYSQGEVEDKIGEFYETFYRCEAAPVGDILAGPKD